MKRMLSLLVLLIVSLFICSCDIFKQNPQTVLTKYLDDFYKGNPAEAYSLLSAKDKRFKSQSDYQEELQNPFFKLAADKATYKIKDIKINGDSAEATVEITGPDLSKAAMDLMGLALASAFGKKNDKDMEKIIAEKFKDKSFPTTTTTDQYILVKESDGWRVFMNWEGIKKAQEMIDQGEQLEKAKKFDEAKAKYQQAISHDRNNKPAHDKLATVDKKVEEYKIKKAYFDKIEVRGIHIGTGYFGETGIFGEVKNTGDRILKEVEVIVYCLDKDGNVVFEKAFSPVLVTEYSYSFSRDNTPLKPNYSRKFGFKLDDAPSDWSKKVRVEVTDVDFQ